MTRSMRRLIIGFWVGVPLLACSPGAAMADRATAETWVDDGDTRYYQRDFAGAEGCFSQAISADNTWAVPYNNRGLARMKLGKIGQQVPGYAENDFAIAISKDAAYIAPLLNRAKCYASQKNWGPAIADINAALQLHPTASQNASLLYNLGWIYDEQALYQQAITQYQLALSLNSSHTKAKLGIAIAQAKLGQTTDAVNQFYNVINEAQQNDINVNLAAYDLQLLRGAGLSFQDSQAASNYKEAVFQCAVEQYDDARVLLGRVQPTALAIPDIPWMGYWCYIRQGQTSNAYVSLQQAYSLMPLVAITSVVPGADVYIDGVKRGTTPCEVPAFLSRYDLNLRQTIGSDKQEWAGPVYTDGTPGGSTSMFLNPTAISGASFTSFGSVEDADRDWLADTWERRWFSGLGYGPADDETDHDGVNNLWEFWASTSPHTVDQAPHGSVQFKSATYTAREDVGHVRVCVSRVGGFYGQASVTYATADDTAIAGVDYGNATAVLTWANGDVADKYIDVLVIDDNIYEGTKTFVLALSDAVGATLGSPSIATVTLTDTESIPTVQCRSTSYTVGEGGGSVRVYVSRVGGSHGNASVAYTTANGTASSGADYTARSGTLSWASGDAADKYFDVPITEDSDYEADESFTVILSNAAGFAALGSPASTTISITDNDPLPRLQFKSASYSSPEVGSVRICVCRVGGSYGTASVNYTANSATAEAGSDYTETNGSLNWSNGETAEKCFDVPITYDRIYEADETFAVVLGNVAGAAMLGSPSSTTVTIMNDDPLPSLQFTLASYTARENAGSIRVCVRRTGGYYGQASVTYDTADGTAKAGSDYSPTSGTLTWSSGDVTDRYIDVPIINDSIFEGSETFSIALSGAVNADLGTPSSTTVTITEDDARPKVQFKVASYTVGEGGGSVRVYVSRVGGSYGNASAAYTTADGTATAGTDYTARSGTLSWTSGDAADKYFDVPITDDVACEGDESFTARLISASGDSLGTLTVATVIIVENEPPTTWYLDADGDGYGVPTQSTQSVSRPAGYVAIDTDCDDRNPAVHPGAADLCGNGLDEDCDGQDPACLTWYLDGDGDGFGDPKVGVISPTQPPGYVPNDEDLCPANPGKTAPAMCGCSKPEGTCGLTPCPDGDTDGDKICNAMDNCPSDSNPDQADADRDGVGDVCDECPDDPNKAAPGLCGCRRTETAGCPQVFGVCVQGPSGRVFLDNYSPGTWALVTAPQAPDGQRFDHWSGDVAGTDNPVRVLMDKNISLTANYADCPRQSMPCGAGAPVCGLAGILCLGVMRIWRRRAAGWA